MKASYWTGKTNSFEQAGSFLGTVHVDVKSLSVLC
jgi:hypothetical protein